MARRKDDDGLIRLNKLLSNRGIESRRHVEEMILAGRIRIDGELATEKGMKVRPDARIEVDGKLITGLPQPVWLALHKPRGYVCTREDDRDRPIVMDLFPAELRHAHSIGRLDGDVSGLLLFTNQGELTHRLTHPRYEVDKVYVAHTGAPFSEEQRRKLEAGIELDDGRAAPARCFVRNWREGTGSLVELTIHEGRKHQVKRMFIAAGNRVRRLERIRVGPVDLGDLPRANWRHLTPDEVRALYEEAGLALPAGADQTFLRVGRMGPKPPARPVEETREQQPERRPERDDRRSERSTTGARRSPGREGRSEGTRPDAVESDWRRLPRWESHGAKAKGKPARPRWMDEGRAPRPHRAGGQEQGGPEPNAEGPRRRDDRPRRFEGSRGTGERPFRGREDSGREDRPRRFEGSRGTGERPFRGREDSAREDRPRRFEGSRGTGERPFRGREDSGREDRPRRFEGSRGTGERPFRGREDSAREDRPRRFEGSRGTGERPFRGREESGREDRPRRFEGSRGTGERPFRGREESGREDRPRRFEGSRGTGERPFRGREDSAREDRPRRFEGSRGTGERPFRGREESGREDRPPRGDGHRHGPGRPPRPGRPFETERREPRAGATRGGPGKPTRGREPERRVESRPVRPGERPGAPRSGESLRPSTGRPPKGGPARGPGKGGAAKTGGPNRPTETRSARQKLIKLEPMRNPRGPRTKGPNRGRKR